MVANTNDDMQITYDRQNSKYLHMKNIITLFLTVVFSISLLANVPNAEKNILIKLNQSTNGSQWKVKWDLNAPVSTWYGVKNSK